MGTAILGIVGGVGPAAGLDLLVKVGQEAGVSRDQDHPNVILVSFPAAVVDRTAYLLGEETTNPGEAVAGLISRLADWGATHLAVACNTSHAEKIWRPIAAAATTHSRRPVLLHIMEVVASGMAAEWPSCRRVGVLSTTGTRLARCYPLALERVGVEVVLPDEHDQEKLVHQAIYHHELGLKARQPATAEARAWLESACRKLAQKGAEAVILGCTELPTALSGTTLDGMPLIDPNRMLARALISATRP